LKYKCTFFIETRFLPHRLLHLRISDREVTVLIVELRRVIALTETIILAVSSNWLGLIVIVRLCIGLSIVGLTVSLRFDGERSDIIIFLLISVCLIAFVFVHLIFVSLVVVILLDGSPESLVILCVVW
jgi:hypothetical protein